MHATNNVDSSSSSQARRALLIASALSFLGSALGLSAIMKGQVSGGEAAIVIAGGVFGLVALVVLLADRQLSVEKFAAVTTAFYTLYLSSGIVCSLLRNGNHKNLYVYLVWCFTLLVFNKLVNVPSVGRFLAKFILLAPLILLGCLFSRVVAFFPIGAVYTLVAFCISYLCFGLMLDAVTQYRDAYIVERETAKSLRIQSKVMEAAHSKLREQSELLDKAQDAIFVQDMESRILYWNQGAQRLFGWTAAEVIGLNVADVFHSSVHDMRRALSSVVQQGEWIGELSKKHKNGSDLIVESRCTLVRTGNETPHSILAINTDITDRKAAEARIHNLAFHDVLTGLPNRALLRERLEKALVATNELQNCGALLLIDLDDFKTLNDTSGHDVGDCLLQAVATRLKSCIRSSDTAARLGGDEFVVVLLNLSGDPESAKSEARCIGESIVRAFRQPYFLQHQEYEGTASAGATLFHGRSETVDDLLKRADLAMYRAKAQGRNRLCLFDPAMESAAASRVALLADLKKALTNGELELHYQPQVTSDRQVVGCEALLRWRHPMRGMVPPNEFIPLAEADGLIVELGYWVLDTACLQLAAWARLPGKKNLQMAVNVSIRQFFDSRFVQFVEKTLCMSGADPKKLKLEITESFMMERVDDVIAKMSALKAHGIGFSMDDFGTGYSSLSQLKRLPLDQLKIDQSFLRGVPDGVRDASIVRTIIALGQSLNLAIIAEGVETDRQRVFLEEHGCCAYQGYYFSPALPLSKFEEFVEGMHRSKTQSAA